MCGGRLDHAAPRALRVPRDHEGKRVPRAHLDLKARGGHLDRPVRAVLREQPGRWDRLGKQVLEERGGPLVQVREPGSGSTEGLFQVFFDPSTGQLVYDPTEHDQ